jgi:hypothetical protein
MPYLSFVCQDPFHFELFPPYALSLIPMYLSFERQSRADPDHCNSFPLPPSSRSVHTSDSVNLTDLATDRDGLDLANRGDKNELHRNSPDYTAERGIVSTATTRIGIEIAEGRRARARSGTYEVRALRAARLCVSMLMCFSSSSMILSTLSWPRFAATTFFIVV